MTQSSRFLSTLRLRNIRSSRWVRELTTEVRVSQSQLIQPLFAVQDLKERQQVPGLTGVYRETDSTLLRQLEADLEAGVRKFILFPVPASKSSARADSPGREMRDRARDFGAETVRLIKKTFGSDLLLMVDVCLCSSTEHGHCGVISTGSESNVDRHLEQVMNDQSVEALVDYALAYATAGADCVAPSDMMDGRIGAIRKTLDNAGLGQTLLMSYAAKFHSKFYGPFRLAADSAPKAGGTSAKSGALKDRATYQINPGSPRDALRCAQRDAEEGADILMVKPGLPYLDVLKELSSTIPLPWSAYEVSGEYAGVELMAREGLIDGPKAHVEAWTSLVRAGAQSIITYGARNARAWLADTLAE